MAEVKLLEHGDLCFLYTPRVRPRPELPFEADERVTGPRDVQRLHVVLSPRDRSVYRRLLVGRKRMPEPKRQRFWARKEAAAREAGETPAGAKPVRPVPPAKLASAKPASRRPARRR